MSLLKKSTVSILLLASLLSTSSVFSAAVVIGSYQRMGNAEQTRIRAQTLLSMDVIVVKTEVNSKIWYRVLIHHSEPRSLISELEQQGFKGAWVLIDAGPVAGTITAEKTDAGTASKPLTQTLETRKTETTAGPVVEVVQTLLRNSPEKPRKPMGQRKVLGQKKLLQTIEGIPIHRIAVANFAHSDVNIKLDGRVDEEIWEQVALYDNMIVAVPGTGEPGHYATEMRMIATDRGLYVSAIMYQPPESLVSRMSTRDDFIDRDTFGVTLDASGEGLMAYWFIVALGDSLMDGKVLPERNYQRDWDGPWLGKSAKFDEGWSVEMFLPWSMMNMPEVKGARNIGFAVSRQVSHTNERYQWPGHPYASSRFVSALNSLKVEGVQPIRQFSIIPFASSTIDQARDDDNVRAGFDLSWKPSPKLELSFSASPDFGAVEADNVVLNLTAFETFFPEKRLFFLEGNEVFSSTPRSSPGNIMRTLTNENFATTSRRVFSREFSPTPISLMNTRRIGGTANQVAVPDGASVNRGERDLPTDLLGASKLTGSVGDMRYGVLAAVEDDVEWMATDELGQEIGIAAPGREFGVARFLYESVSDSRHSIGYLGTFVSGPRYDAIVHGLDMHYTNGSGRLIVDGQLLASDVDDVSGEGLLFDLKYSSSLRIQHKLEIDYFDETVDINDLGFLRRNDYSTLQYALLYNNTKGFKRLKDIRGTFIFRQGYNISKGQVIDSGIYWRNSMVLPGRNTVKTALGYLPSRYEDIDSRGNGAYKTHRRWWFDTVLATDAGKMLSYSFGVGGLQENLSDWTVNLSAGVTFRPSDLVSVDLDLRYKRRYGWLVYQGGRNFGRYKTIDWQPALMVNWFMTPVQQLRFTLQWVGVQAKEDGFFAVPAGDGALVPAERTLPSHDFTVSIVTAQLRYRWEIAPLTDLYLVYNLGNTLTNQVDSDFSGLFHDSLSDPIIRNFVAKLRYRFGN